jgi:hypothetical protein
MLRKSFAVLACMLLIGLLAYGFGGRRAANQASAAQSAARDACPAAPVTKRLDANAMHQMPQGRCASVHEMLARSSP